MKRFFFFSLGIFLATAGYSQSIKSYVITSAGAALMDGEGGIYISIGEPMNTEIEGEEIMISQGFLNVTLAGAPLSDDDLLTEVIKAFPNPTVATVSIDLPEMSGEYDYVLTDVHGQLITRQQITDRTTKVDFEAVTSGTYFLKVTKDNRSSKTLKIVKL